MIAARAWDIYAEKAKERQRSSGGDRKSSRAKSVPAKTPEPISGDTRELMGAALNVAGTSVQAARTVIRDGVPELVAADA